MTTLIQDYPALEKVVALCKMCGIDVRMLDDLGARWRLYLVNEYGVVTAEDTVRDLDYETWLAAVKRLKGVP